MSVVFFSAVSHTCPPVCPPAAGQRWWKDLLLAVSVLVALSGCCFALLQRRRSKDDVDKLMKDLECLHRAEQSLLELQEKLVQRPQLPGCEI